MPDRLFRDRRDAGRTLASLLEHYRGRDDVVVLGLPRGGVPPAYEVAKGLGALLFVFDHFTQDSPAAFLLFALTDGGLCLLTIGLLLRAPRISTR